MSMSVDIVSIGISAISFLFERGKEINEKLVCRSDSDSDRRKDRL